MRQKGFATTEDGKFKIEHGCFLPCVKVYTEFWGSNLQETEVVIFDRQTVDKILAALTDVSFRLEVDDDDWDDLSNQCKDAIKAAKGE